jgi:hypothetical protein
MHKTGQYLRPGTGRIRPLAISKQVTEIHNATKLETMLGGVGTQTGNCNPPARLDTVYIIGLVVQCGSGSLRQDGPYGTTAVVAGCPSVPSPPRHAKPKDDPSRCPAGVVSFGHDIARIRVALFFEKSEPLPGLSRHQAPL